MCTARRPRAGEYVRYGTPAQQAYYLPRLASGQLIPCFGLTGPHSGSDATSLIGSYGDVEERDGELGVRATFYKRYITLGANASTVFWSADLPLSVFSTSPFFLH